MDNKSLELQRYFSALAEKKQLARERFWVLRDFVEEGLSLQPTEPMEFYRELFPKGELEHKAARDENGKPVYDDTEYKYTGIVVEIQEGFGYNGEPSRTAKRRNITDDLQVLEDLQASDNFCFLSPISYIGKSRESKNARMLYALCIEVDNLVFKNDKTYPEGLINLVQQFDSGVLPRPTYLVLSGNGVHLYYFLEEPIALFNSARLSLSKFKYDLTTHIWNKYVTTTHTQDTIQYESLFQPFRLVGGVTKSGARTVAYKLGERVSIEYLNSGNWVFPENRIDLGYQPPKRQRLTLERAEKLYPEWYQERIVEGNPSKNGSWVCNRAVYDWWKQKIEFAQVGHRYYCLMCLSIYAIKCDIDREELEKDCFSFLDKFDALTDEESNHFTERDVISAIQTFEDKDLVRYPIKAIVYRSGIPIEKNKRNYRKQSVHLKHARLSLEDKNEEYGVTLQGRPDKQKIVQDWRQSHPAGRKADCVRDTGLDKKTVYKWWA